MKTLLRKNTQPHALCYEELYTLLVDAEAILNSRPITPLQQDEEQDGQYLTAGHFLIGRPLRAPPTAQPPTGKLSGLRRWNLVSKLRSNLWKQWLTTYLASQAQRTKWIRPGRPLQVGDLVFVKDETIREGAWPLARVEEIYPGSDGQVRTVKLRCRKKTFNRPTNLLIHFVPDNSPSSDPGSLSGN